MAEKTSAWAAAESAARVAWLDQGAGNAYLTVYGTAKPLTPGAAPGGPVLLRVDLAKPSGIVQPDGSLVLLLANDVVAGLASGTASWARLHNGADQPGLDMLVSSFASSSGEVRLSRLALSVGSVARVALATLK